MRPFYQDASITIFCGDCREVLPTIAGAADAVLADPPYEETSLVWDAVVPGWLAAAREAIKPAGSAWVFGSLRHFLRIRDELSGWLMSQDIIWEKHNGSNPA